MFRLMFLAGLAFTILFLLLSIILFVKNDVAKLIGDITGWNARRAIKKINTRGAEEISKTQAIKTEVSKVLVHSVDTTNPIHKKLELKPKQSIMAAIHEAQGKPVEEVFRAEEEMIVLAGQEVAGAEGEKMADDEITTILGEEDETTVLPKEEGTAASGEENELTAVLEEEVTTVLGEGEELTAVLGEELTTVLSEGDELTAVLGKELTTVLSQENELTTVLGEGEEATRMLIGEEKPLPDIFEVEDQATVVHTEESIGDEFTGE